MSRGETTLQRIKQTPILVPDGVFPRDDVLARFRERGEEVDADIVEFIEEKLKGYPG